MIHKYFDEEIDATGSKNLLYFAPINGLENKFREDFSVTTLDINRDDVDVKADITELPFKKSSFDIVLCSHVLEHVPDDLSALTELRRVINQEGEGIILVPQNRDMDTTLEDPTATTEEERERKFGQHNHVRWYGNDFSSKLVSAGFKVSERDYVIKLNNGVIEKHRLRESEKWIHDHTLIFYVNK